MKKTVHIFITGVVQNVGFRQFIVTESEIRGVTGWVKNLSDGRVETEISGEEALLAEMITLCKQGSYASEVSDVTVEWKDARLFTGFEIR